MTKILSIALLNVFLILVAGSQAAFGQNELNIVPMPAEVKMEKGFCVLIEPIGFLLLDNSEGDEEGNDGEELFQQWLTKNYGIKKFVSGDSHSYGLPTEIFYTGEDVKRPKGYYELEVTGNKIYIKGTVLGVFYAFETLKQMISVNAKKEIVIPNCKIKDWPRFQYRGMHLDVGRHFFPVSYVKKYIDYLAAYKYNTFHWHLTEDQGWRIEIKKYPELIKVGAKRNGTIVGRYPGKGSDNISYGGFYTQAQIKEVVEYAKERHIDVIPEIEMPGHSSAAIAAYPWLSCFPAKPTAIPANMISKKSVEEQKNGRIKLVQETWGVFDDVFCAGKDSTFKFLENVIDEVITLFPSKYFHIGGDESPKTHWKKCPACQARIKSENLKDEHELQSYFVQRIEKYLNSKGKILIGWDEILEGGLAPNAVVMSWRGEKGGIEAAKQSHQVIMTPESPLYINHSQNRNEDSITQGGYNPLEAVYNYDPIPKVLNAEQGRYILGAQGNMWAEYLGNQSKLEYMLFPRMIALSEVLWSPKEKRDWKDFEKRLPGIFERLDKEKINYSRAYYDLKATVMPTENFEGVLWKVESKVKDVRININPGIYSYAQGYTEPVKILSSDSYSASLYSNGKEISVISQKFFFNKATGKKITLVTPPSDKYPGDGAFTLVNGVQNEMGMMRTSEFLGFSGTDLVATIDLKTETDISKITIHVLDQNGSWIYLPSQVEIVYAPNVDYTEENMKTFPKEIKTIDPIKDKGIKTITIESKQKCRFLHVTVKNFGIIPSGNPGAGNPAWLFVDEIEAN